MTYAVWYTKQIRDDKLYPSDDEVAELAWNGAMEEAALLCESQLTRHGERKGGSDGPDATRRALAVRIRALKTIAE